MGRDELTAYLAVLVGAVWAVVALVSLAIRDYSALYAVSPVMLAVVGFYFGLRNGKGGS